MPVDLGEIVRKKYPPISKTGSMPKGNWEGETRKLEPHVLHRDLARFADQVVNLPAEHVRKHRKQVNGLRDRLAKKIADDPDFALVKMLHSGSVAKGTALRTINDMDVAVYVGKLTRQRTEKNYWTGSPNVFVKLIRTCRRTSSRSRPTAYPSSLQRQRVGRRRGTRVVRRRS